LQEFEQANAIVWTHSMRNPLKDYQSGQFSVVARLEIVIGAQIWTRSKAWNLKAAGKTVVYSLSPERELRRSVAAVEDVG